MCDPTLSGSSDSAGIAEGEVPGHLQHQTLVSNLPRTLHSVGHDRLGHCSLRLLAAELPLHDHCQEKREDCCWYVTVLIARRAHY